MIVSVLHGIRRAGEAWDARYANPIISVAGGIELDFRNAQLEEGETELTVISLLGSIDITLPEDVPALVTGLSALGSRTIFGQSEGGFAGGTDQATPDYARGGRRRLRLNVYSALGGVDVRQGPARIAVVA